MKVATLQKQRLVLGMVVAAVIVVGLVWVFENRTGPTRLVGGRDDNSLSAQNTTPSKEDNAGFDAENQETDNGNSDLNPMPFGVQNQTTDFESSNQALGFGDANNSGAFEANNAPDWSSIDAPNAAIREGAVHDFGNYIRDEVTLRDPNTGELQQAEAGYNNYYSAPSLDAATGQDAIVGTDGATPTPSDATPYSVVTGTEGLGVTSTDTTSASGGGE